MKPLDARVLACVDAGEPDEPGVTTSDVVRHLRWQYALHKEHSTVAKRLSDLHAAGLVRPVGSRVSPLTGRRQTAWAPTARGRKALARASKAVGS